MFRLYGYATQNTMKVIYVLEELGVDYEFQLVDLSKQEQKSENFSRLTPIGKTPVLQHDSETLFESGAICRYVANLQNSPLYPAEKMKRAKVDQWLDYLSCHLGRWLSSFYYEKLIKPNVGRGETNLQKCEEYGQMARQELAVVNRWLSQNAYFTGSDLSIADLFGFAYVEQTKELNINLSDYSQLKAWLEKISERASVQRGHQKIAKWHG